MAVRRPDLWRLAPNPLLLTVMALVHTHKGRLPDARALVAAIASINAKKLGRQLGLPLIWGPGFRHANPMLDPMGLGP